MGKKHPLTEEERLKTLKLREEGCSYKNIAKKMHRSKVLITEFLKNYMVTSAEGHGNKKSRTFVRINYAEVVKNENPSESEEFEKIPMEYRAIIKFLTKEGHNSQEISTEMKAVYNKSPYINSMSFWSDKFKSGKKPICREQKAKNSPLKIQDGHRTKLQGNQKDVVHIQTGKQQKANTLVTSGTSKKMYTKQTAHRVKNKKLFTIKFPILKKT